VFSCRILAPFGKYLLRNIIKRTGSQNRRKLAASKLASRLTVEVSSCVSEARLRRIQIVGLTLPIRYSKA
jgi:hypothetical protein